MVAKNTDAIVNAVTAFFTENANADNTISADQLTVLISEYCEHDYSAKTVRAHMRKMAQRDQTQFRGATWRIVTTVAESELRYFARNLAQ